MLEEMEIIMAVIIIMAVTTIMAATTTMGTMAGGIQKKMEAVLRPMAVRNGLQDLTGKNRILFNRGRFRRLVGMKIITGIIMGVTTIMAGTTIMAATIIMGTMVGVM